MRSSVPSFAELLGGCEHHLFDVGQAGGCQ